MPCGCETDTAEALYKHWANVRMRVLYLGTLPELVYHL